MRNIPFPVPIPKYLINSEYLSPLIVKRYPLFRGTNTVSPIPSLINIRFHCYSFRVSTITSEITPYVHLL